MDALGLSLVVLTHKYALGKHFYKYNPYILVITLLPMSLAYIAWKLHSRDRSDKFLEQCYQYIDRNPCKKQHRGQQNTLLRIEKWLYLLSSFFADTLKTMAVSHSLLISFIPISFIPPNIFIFLASICYAVYIHAYYRFPDLEDLYYHEENIAQYLPSTLDLKPLLITLSTYFLFSLAFSLNPEYPIQSMLVLLVASISLTLYAAKFFKTTYIFYACWAITKTFKNFTRHILKQLRMMKLASITPAILSISDGCVSSLILLHSCMHYLQTQRHAQLSEKLQSESLKAKP